MKFTGVLKKYDSGKRYHESVTLLITFEIPQTEIPKTIYLLKYLGNTALDIDVTNPNEEETYEVPE